MTDLEMKSQECPEESAFRAYFGCRLSPTIVVVTIELGTASKLSQCAFFELTDALNTDAEH
jgi:hypothetical protein